MAGSRKPTLSRRALLAAPAAACWAQGQNLAADWHRPKYHFLPPSQWMNDPNGPIYWRGKYHIFYQHNPHAPVWGDMHWGHATSSDLVHWAHQDIALEPTRGGYDKDGVFSGCAVDNNGVPTIVYTGTQPEVQCLATSIDECFSWTKHPANPVIAGPPDGMQVTGFRDPCVWHEGDFWYMALGSGILERGGMVLLYRSPDLVVWEYLHPLFEGTLTGKSNPKSPVASGEMWECPSFFALDKKHVLMVSTEGTTPFWVGEYGPDQHFTPSAQGRLDCGDYYAPITQLDESGRRIVWGWVQERRSREAQVKAGWSGVLSLPRQVSLRRDGRLSIEPAPQCRLLRGTRQAFANLLLPDNRPMRIPGVAGDSLELTADFELGDADEVGLRVLEDVAVAYHAGARRLSVGAPRAEAAGQFTLDPGEPLRLQVFVDCSIVEVFFNGRGCYTGRAYPESYEKTGVYAYAKAGTARLRSLVSYEMKPISNNRLTT